MKQVGKAKKTVAILLTAMLAAALTLQTAAIALASGEKATLTIRASSGGKKISGVEWSAYQVADMPQDGKFTLTSDFKDSGLDIDSLNDSKQSDMEKSAKKLLVYITSHQIKSAGSKITDSKGDAKMTGLERGLYLICQTGTPGTNLTVESTPFFVALPTMTEQNGKMVMNYDVTASPKLEVEEPPTEPTTEPSTEETTESPTESSTESTTESSTESSTEPSTESSTEASTEPSSGQTESTEESIRPTTGGGSGGGGGRHDRDRGTTIVEIYDNETPLASFLPPESNPELIEIEEDPVPLGAFPTLPKMGDMGTGAYVAGIMISLITGCGALIRRKKYTGGEK